MILFILNNYQMSAMKLEGFMTRIHQLKGMTKELIKNYLLIKTG